jgi:hypothetical protein
LTYISDALDMNNFSKALSKYKEFKGITTLNQDQSGEILFGSEWKNIIDQKSLYLAFMSALRNHDIQTNIVNKERSENYLHQHHKYDRKIRFALISVELYLQGEFIHLDHLKYAF